MNSSLNTTITQASSTGSKVPCARSIRKGVVCDCDDDFESPPPSPSEEKKGSPLGPPLDKSLNVQKTLSTVLGSVFVPGKTYRFRLTRTAVLTTSGSGGLAIATAVYPSQFQEYTALAGLFKEARLRSSRIHYVGIGASSNAFISAFDPTYTSGTPSFASTLQQVGSKLWNLNVVNTKRENRYRVRGLRPWSVMAATPSGIDPLGGVCGAWYHVIQGTGPTSTDVMVYTLEVDYELRNPQ